MPNQGPARGPAVPCGAVAGLRELGSGGGGSRRLDGLVEVAAVHQPMNHRGVEDHRELPGEGDQRLHGEPTRAASASAQALSAGARALRK
jgi:hypothetical protein